MPKQTFFNLPDEKRCLIIDLAIEEFAEHDYKNASISNIVARAGVAKGSMYQYFEDKRDLYFYLLQLATEEKKAFLSQTPPPDPSMSLFDYLRWMIRMGARFELSRPRLAQVAYRALFSDRPFGDEPFVQIRRQVMDFYDNLVEMGIAQGTIDPYIDRGVAVFILSTLFNEFGRFLIERHNIRFENLASGETTYQELLVEELAGHLIRILERGFAPAPQKTGAVNHA
jgi:TetR/AcrR family transcriptional regulator